MPLTQKYINDNVCCAHCQGKTWNVYLDKDSKGLIHLVICCNDKACTAAQRKRLGGEDGSLVISFDIVVGHDEDLDTKIIDSPGLLN